MGLERVAQDAGQPLPRITSEIQRQRFIALRPQKRTSSPRTHGDKERCGCRRTTAGAAWPNLERLVSPHSSPGPRTCRSHSGRACPALHGISQTRSPRDLAISELMRPASCMGHCHLPHLQRPGHDEDRVLHRQREAGIRTVASIGNRSLHQSPLGSAAR